MQSHPIVIQVQVLSNTIMVCKDLFSCILCSFSDASVVLQYIRRLFGSIVKIVTLRKRLGLIGARLEGVKHVTGDVLCFLDSHMEVNRHWYTQK